MTDSAPPENASPPDPVARPATTRSAPESPKNEQQIEDLYRQALAFVAARESETRKSSPRVADLMLRARSLRLKPGSSATTPLVRQRAAYTSAGRVGATPRRGTLVGH